MTLQKLAYTSMIVTMLLLLWLTAVSLTSRPVTTNDMYQSVNQDTGVICFILSNGNGMSCLPLDDVNLDDVRLQGE
jgi:hypothetical protein